MALSGSIIKTFHNNGYSLILEWSATQSITNNTSTITAKLYLKSNSSSYIINSTANKTVKIKIDGSTYTKTDAKVGLGGNEKKLLYTASKTVTHNADGTKTVSMGGSAGIKVTLSGIWYDTVYLPDTNFTLTTIPRASSITTFANFTIGNSIPVAISRASASFTHDLILKVGSTTVATRTGIGTTTTLVLSTTEQNNIYSAIPSATSTTVTLYCTTKDGSTTIGSTVSKNATASVSSSIVPTFSFITASETVSSVSTNVGAYVQNLSKIKFTINGASGAKYSTISSYQITFDGATYNSSTATTGVINKSGTITARGKITDSRGRTATKTVNVTLLAYSTPSITTLTVSRCNSDGSANDMGTYAKVTRIGSVSSLNSKNYYNIKVYSRARGTSNWGTAKVDATSSAGAINMNYSNLLSTYDVVSSYDFKIEFKDMFYTTTATAVLSTGGVTMSWGKDGIGLGKIWEKGALDVGGTTYLNGAIPTQESSSATLQVNGFMRTGNVYLHTGGGAPDGVRNGDYLANVNGDLKWAQAGVQHKVWHDGNFSPNQNISFASGSSYRIGFTDGMGISSVLKRDIVFRNLSEFRFGSSNSWDWNVWAGIRYNSVEHKLYMGGPAGSQFTANASPPTITMHLDQGVSHLYCPSTILEGGTSLSDKYAHSGNTRHGRIDIYPTANSATSVSLSYGITFSSTPTIVASAISSVPGSTVKEVSTGSPSTTSCNIYIYRTNTTKTSVSWIATNV